MYKLLKIAGAIPYFMVVFLNAFVDLGHKITIQNTIFKIHDGTEQVILTAIVNGLILLPFILFFVPAGKTTDRLTKTTVMRLAAWFAVAVTSLITLFYALGWFWAAFCMTFLLAAQSAFYSPAKFSYIKLLFGKNQLTEANGLTQTITIIAILMGTFAFSIFFELNYSDALTTKPSIIQQLVPVGLLLIIGSIIELIMAYRLPALAVDVEQEEQPATHEPTSQNHTSILKPIFSNQAIFLAIIGTAVFWSVGQVMLAGFPAFAKETLGVTNTIAIQGVLAASGIGIAIGSAIAARVSQGYIETGLIPIGALGMATGLSLITFLDSLTTHAINYLFIGIMGGIFIVPLNALIQFHSKNSEIGKVLAGKNLIQNLSMLSFLILTALFATLGVNSRALLIIVAVVTTIGGLYTVLKLPQSLVRFVLLFIFTRRYRVKVQGIKNLPEQGGVLLLGNHISWIDWAIIQIASPRQVRFVMTKDIYQLWYLKWFFDLFGVVAIESGVSSRNSLAQVSKLLNKGEVVCIFPEGTISRTGHLAEFRRGYEKACADCHDEIKIVPLYLRGLWGSQFSRSTDNVKQKSYNGIYRDVIVAFGEPLAKDTTADQLKRKVFDLSVKSWNSYTENLPTLTHTWIDTVKRLKYDNAIIDPITGNLSASKALAGAITFSKHIRKISPEKNIGILLPMTAGAVLTNMATLIAGKTVVNLNYTSTQEAIASAIEQAEIKHIYTSKKFIQKLSKKGIELSNITNKVNIIYLEELKNQVSQYERIRNWLAVKLLPAYLIKLLFLDGSISNRDTAAILFSSGSDGAPKGIELSHQNITANLKQISDVLNTQSHDRVMASLPLFHALGLTVTQFMPLIEGIPMVCHPDPTDVLNIAKAIGKHKATILFGTSTFFRLYTKNQKVHPLMLDSLRAVIAGAEKLKPEVRDAFERKFNKIILEGYGATETTPVASVNIPDTLDTEYWKVQLGNKVGTVGMPLPGTSFKIADPDTLEELATGEQGMILIGGTQVMTGYLNNQEKTQEVIQEESGIRWYITGDKGYLDQDGFLTIVDRYSRFAKLGGEMISLATVENQIYPLIDNDELELCAVNIADNKKGEKIILLANQPISLQELKKELLEKSHNPLTFPSEIIITDIPKLGSGKTHFSKAKETAIAAMNPSGAI